MCDCSVSTLVPPPSVVQLNMLLHSNALNPLQPMHTYCTAPLITACPSPTRELCLQPAWETCLCTAPNSQSVCLPCDHASSRLPDGHGHPTLSSGAACVMYDPGSHGCRPLLSTCQSARLRLSAVHKFLPTFSCPCRTTSIPIIPLDPSMVAYMSRACTTREQEKRQSSS